MLASLVAQRLKHLPAMWETWVRSRVGKIPWRGKWQPTPVFLPGESHGRKSLEGYSAWGHTELDMTERLNSTACCGRTVVLHWSFYKNHLENLLEEVGAKQ